MINIGIYKVCYHGVTNSGEANTMRIHFISFELIHSNMALVNVPECLIAGSSMSGICEVLLPVVVYISVSEMSRPHGRGTDMWAVWWDTRWSDFRFSCLLTHLTLHKTAAILQMTFLKAFSWMKMFEFSSKFHWSLLLWVQFTINELWFR